MMNNYLKGPAQSTVKHLESDPLSIISIFAKRHAPPVKEEAVQQTKKTSVSPSRPAKRASPTRLTGSSKSHLAVTKGSKTHKQGGFSRKQDDEIEEDIVAESRDQDKTDTYSQDHITESIISDVPKGESTSAIEESIQESIPNASGNAPMIKVQTSATNDSIPEEDYLRKSGAS